MRPAVELSYLDEDAQRDIVEEIDLNDCTPSHAQTIKMRRFFEEGKLDTAVIQSIMEEEKPNQRDKIVIRGDKVKKLLPQNLKVSEREEYICKALEHYTKFLIRQREDRSDR